jgi:diguanylate cyclase (GGDEF)-like protein
MGLGGLAVAFLLLGVEVKFFVQPNLDQEVEAQGRALVRYRAQQELLAALMEEEVALRGFLETGNPANLERVASGSRDQGEPLRVLSDCLPGTRDRELLAHLEFTIGTFHGRSAMPLVAARLRGPLKDLQGALAREGRAFQDVKDANERLTQVLDAQDDERLEAIETTLAYARWLGYGTAAAVFLLAAGAARWVHLRVAAPLAELAEHARTGDGFPEPERAPSVKEVDILGRTLRELDAHNREREQVLRLEHEEALATQAFDELVQHLSTEEDLLQALGQALARQVQAVRLSVLLQTPSGEGLVSVIPPLDPAEAARFPVLAAANRCRAIHQGAPVCLASEAPTCCICPLGVPSAGSYLCLPMVASGRTLGLVNLQARNPAHWNPGRRRMAEAMVSTSAAALQALRSLDLARERAIRDSLTGLFNRGFLDEFLPKAFDQALRKELPLSLLMMDIDHFKAFNDEFGHEGGDTVLRLFAQALQAHVRSGDVVTRYGGEEFAVLLPHADPATAFALAERLREAVQAIPLPEGLFPRDRRITTSIGLASFPDHARDRGALVTLADQALYEAKGLGRNRTIGAGDLGLGLPGNAV